MLGLSVLSISERDSQKERVFGDFMNIGLVTVTLIIDVVALSAMVFRVTSYGFTPNRLAVLGANLLIFCHLTGIVYHYARLVFRKSAFTPLETWIASYLPAYTLWSIIVAFAFPLAFGFK